MGMAKSQMIEVMERGWSDPETWVCIHCVGEDKFLKSLIRKNLTNQRCSYCFSSARKAAPLVSLMGALYRGLKSHFNDEASAGCPYDREIEIECISSQDALFQLLDFEGLDWPEKLVTDVSDSFENTGWVEAPGGDWFGAFQHERLFWSWESFSSTVKHTSRFHFHVNRRNLRWNDDPISAHEMLPFIGKLVRKIRLIRKIPITQILYRTRAGTHPLDVNELGPPPREKANAGRMNPAGIPYMYLAFDSETAISEIRVKPKKKVTISSWQVNQELNVVDLTKLPSSPSIFSDKRRERDLIQFLYSFVDEIQQPIEHDGYEHIGYVPTQVVSEYFAQMFKFSDGKRVNGIVYSSSLSPRGKNLVLFPDIESIDFQFGQVKLVDAKVVTSCM
jgi:RES domain-containing protein